MVRKIDTNIWVKEQPFQYLGLDIGTRMTIIRLNNNELMVISPIKINQKLISSINKLGKVKHLILPNLFHHLFVSEWKLTYPDSQIYGVSQLKEKRPDIIIDRFLDKNKQYFADEVEYLPFNGIQTLIPKGIFPLKEYIFFHHLSKTLILTDIAFYFDETFPPLTQITFRLIAGYKKLQPSLLEKIAIKNKTIVKHSFEELLKWDFHRIIVAHGKIIEQEAKEKLQQGYKFVSQI